MPAKRKLVMVGKGDMVVGKGFFSSLKKIGKALTSPIKSALKSTGIVSKGLSLIPGIGSTAALVAKSQGYGRKRKARR